MDIDFDVHSVDEFPGKHLVIGGARYCIQAQIGEGGTKYVFPLKNVQSGLILYVAKIYKHRPGSAEAEEELANLPWRAFALVPAKLGVYTEAHRVRGAALELQPYGITDNAEYCEPLMDRAMALQGSSNWSGASEAYDEVLRQNPHHSMALLNLALAAFNLEQVQHAIECTQRSIEIEPNFPPAYHLVSDILLAVVGPEAALEPLRWTLRRYAADPQTWERLLEIAVQFDLVDVSADALRTVYELGRNPSGQNPPDFARFESAIVASHRRWQDYSQSLVRAHAAQQRDSWREALAHCEAASRSSRNNSIANLNELICKYHLGAGKAIASEVLASMQRSQGIALAGAASLALLCADAAGMRAEAVKLALWIARKFHHHADLPSVLAAVTIAGELMEARSAVPIMAVLRRLSDGAPPAERAEIDGLLRLYHERERAFSSKKN